MIILEFGLKYYSYKTRGGLPNIKQRHKKEENNKLENLRSSTKSKHIDIKFLVVKERGQSIQISIEHLGTNSIIVNPLTKGLPPKAFQDHVAHIGVLQFEESLV